MELTLGGGNYGAYIRIGNYEAYTREGYYRACIRRGKSDMYQHLQYYSLGGNLEWGHQPLG